MQVSRVDIAQMYGDVAYDGMHRPGGLFYVKSGDPAAAVKALLA